MILQADKPEDWVRATGKTTSVREFVQMSFSELGIKLEFKRNGIDEKAFIKESKNPDYNVKIGQEVLSIGSKIF